MAVVALALVRLRDLFAVVMLSGIFSLLAAAFYVLQDAVDVAFTEAAVGAGISTVLMLGTLAFTSSEEKPPARRSLVPLVIVVITGAVLVNGTLDMPSYGDPNAPINLHVAPRYIEDSEKEVGPPNIVTSVLASYRGYDTLGETNVIFTAAIGVMMLIGRLPPLRRGLGSRPDQGRRSRLRAAADNDNRETGPTTRRADTTMVQKPILRVASKLLIPFILLFALYVQFHGDYGPGGGFQAGVIFAAAIILYAILFGVRIGRRVVPAMICRIGLSTGVLIYAGTGVISLFLGGNYLDYSLLSHNAVHGQELGIAMIEFGVGTTVTFAMITIFYIFAARSSYRDPEDR